MGYVPTAAISTSMDTLWSWLKSNYVQSGEESGRGLIQFYKGDFTFTATGGAAVIDGPTGWGSNSTGAGVFIKGQRRATRLIFTPSATTDAAISIDNQMESGVQDLHILINSNVVNAIKVTTTTAGDASARTLFENLKISRSESDGPVVTGQRGIYLSTPSGATSGNVFFSTLRRIYTRFMDTGIELAGTVDVNNTHAVVIDDCGFWGARRGVNIGDRCGQNFVSKILMQEAASPAICEYAVRIGTVSRFNNVYNVSVDAMTKAGSCVVLLDDQAGWNKISGLGNSGAAQAINDYSGQSTNEYDNIQTVGGETYRKKEGAWAGGPYFTHASAGGTGSIMYGGTGILGSGFLAQVGTEELFSVFTHSITDLTEGFASRFTTKTSPVSGDNVGIKSRAFVARRPFNFRLYFRFRVNTANTSSDHRAWFGLWNVDTDFTGDNWLGSSAGLHGIGIGYLLADTTWQFIRNGGTNLEMKFTNTTISNNNTNTHQCIIQSEESPTPRFLINMDGNTLTSFSTTAEIPGNSNLLRLAMGIEINNTNAHSVDIFDIKINQWK